MNFSIFPLFFSFYGTYTKIFIIFGSAHNLLHKIKHKAKTAQKEKEKKHCAASGREIGPRAGPLPLSPRGHRAGALLFAQSLTGGSRSSGFLPPSLYGTLTGRPHPSAPSPSRAAALPWLRPPLARSSAHARVRIGLASSSRPR